MFEISPFPFDSINPSLPTQSSVRADLSSYLAHFKSKGSESVDHRVYGELKFQDLASDFDTDLLSQISTGNGCGNPGYLSDLGRQIHSHTIDIICQITPCALNIIDRSLPTQAPFCTDFSGNLANLSRKLL
ncbi:hypothetical protein RRF57_000330 [Xylaria bambusicola]|uniref:Uncharacterized protein n=1 Tax=Xylaria bambusicola TaxID=326684 RepID=A0AAN7UED6_9PEZI